MRSAESSAFLLQASRWFGGLLTAAALIVNAPAAADTPLKFLLDFRFEGPSAPFLVPLDKGYYKAEDLEVTIDVANGSVEPIAKVASGAYDMGFADINALIRYRDQNPTAGVKAVFMVYNRPPFAVIGRKSRGVTKPKDLEGKKLGAPAGDGAFANWRVFAKINDIDVSKVTVDNVGFPVREPMLAAGQVDAITGYSFSSYISLKDRGVPLDDVVLLMMADHGLDLYGNAIIVSQKFATEKPEAVKAFLRAYVKGLKETIRTPAVAVDSVIKRNDLAKKDVEVDRLRMAIKDNIVTPEVQKHGYGAIDAARLEKSIEQIGLAYEFKAKPKPADIFDDSFLPPESTRRVN
jgi:NitT/TauT family transport system substrate-binding protein